MVDWNRKLTALLHDPADKPLDIQTHEARARASLAIALGREATLEEWQIAKDADHIASAADRLNFPRGLLVDFRDTPALTHPLSGRRNLDLDNLRHVDERGSVTRVIQQLCTGESDPHRKFLKVWRNLTDALAQDTPDMGAVWSVLPADTRMPDHPLPQHLSISAALAGAGQHPAFLVFSVGPVQDFIAAARRTQDLWMGSFLLAQLVWAGMKPIVEQYGPDAILFPSLLDQPVVDQWLADSGLANKPRSESLSIANLPNKFTAILPAAEAQQMAQVAEQAIRAEWQRVAASVRDYLDSLVKVTPDWQTIWERQVGSLPEIYWSVLAWPASAEDAIAQYMRLLGEPHSFLKVYDLLKQQGQYSANLGTVYQLLFDLAERSFAARKGLRDFRPADEKGEQCSVMPGYTALHIGDQTLKGVRKYWSEVAEALQAKDQHAVIKPNGAERLSAIAAIKRFAASTVFKAQGINERYPSITSLTVFPFYEQLAEKLPEAPELESTIRHFTTALNTAHIPTTISVDGLTRHLRRSIRELDKQADVLWELVKYDGEWLFPETYDRNDFENGIDKAALPDVKKLLRRLLDIAKANDIPTPTRYYAVLVMDGDHMGRWLSGTHDKMPEFGALLHPKAVEQLGHQAAEWNDLLQQQRLVTPAYHAAISRALGNFALKCVRRIVEELHPGVLVYAGGDDVLALLPLDHALLVARELRAMFSGHAIIDRDGVRDIDFVSDRHSGYTTIDGQVVLTMGPAATASAGLAIAHHSAPLSGVLAAAREAEQAAKKAYDRNALVVTVLKRSGEVSRMGMRWYYPDVPDSLNLLNNFCDLLSGERLSMKFPNAYYPESRTLAGLPPQALQAELRRLLKRHTEHQQKLTDEEIDSWSMALATLALQLNTHRPGDKRRTLVEEDETPQAGAVELGKWMLLARFLNRGGEE